MQKQNVTHATLVFEHEIPASAEDVFSAYADVDARADWSVSPNDTIIYDHDAFRVGGQDRFRCGPKTNPNIQGTAQYWEIVPNQRIVWSEALTMSDTQLAVALNTLELTPHGTATSLKLTVQVASFTGQGMVDGYQHGNEGALKNLAQRMAGEA